MELEEGQIIGSYRIVRAIGQGGMGTVYEVEHVELGVRYALKTFTFDPTNEASHALKTKFLEEGKVLARLKHPNIAHVFDLAFDEATQMPYFVMDLVTYEDGESYTAEDVDPNDIDEELVYRWFREVSSALDYIHGEGIVHRDIKPSNLLLDKDAHVVLSDFGISRIFGGQLKSAVGAETTMVSKTGRGKLILGTMKYMAPEVSLGDEVMPEADAYALGVMTLRWLTGFYYSDNPGALGLLAKKKYHWVPVLARLLAPDPARRPQTYSDLVKQLKPLASGDAASSPRQKGVTAAASAEGKRSPLARIITILLVVVACCGVAAGLYFGWQFVEDRTAKRDRQIAELRDQMRAREEAAAAKAKAEAEEEARRKAEEERLAAEKKAQEEAERKAQEEKWRRDEEKSEAEAKARAAAAARAASPRPAPAPAKKQREFVQEGSIANKKDYGPIPDRNYSWFADGMTDAPQKINFLLANGVRLELVPRPAGSFYMSNQADELKGWHKVTLTRPFWMTRTCLTTDQWREFAAGDCDDCRDVEKELSGKALLYIRLTRKAIDDYCAYLTGKYQSQLPKGYVFRLPSEAERMAMADIDATIAKYDRPGSRGWGSFTSIGGDSARSEFAKIREGKMKGPLGKLNADGTWRDMRYHVGGLAQPAASGIVDLFGWYRWVLDIVERGRKIPHADEEVDPLWWCESGLYNNRKALSVIWEWDYWRDWSHLDAMRLCHIVLGPDLIGQKAWNNPRKNVETNAAVPRQRAKFDPKKIPSKCNPKKSCEIALKRVGGRDMVFCGISRAKFNMSNVNGQAKACHKVELTSPFWMSKFCVTADEWREYAPNDFNTRAVLTAERAFSDRPVSVNTTYARWTAYCDFLNKRYGALLPPGYVFRLPTEAEWEWTFIADEKGNVRRMSDECCNANGRLRSEFDALAKRKVPAWRELGYNSVGFFGHAFVGGRTQPTGFGVFDIVVHGERDVMMLDTFDTQGGTRDDGSVDWAHADAAKELVYDDRERDPVRFAGLSTRYVMTRSMGAGRQMRDTRHPGYAHIVIAPDILAPLRAKEVAPFPEEDFGGGYLGANVVRVDQSSELDGKWRNGDKQFKRMVSRENVVVARQEKGEDTRGFHTQHEDSPWILLDLGKKCTVTGLAIDAFYGCTKHLCVWVSDDGKHERLVDKEELERKRYRIDLRVKNVKGRYIRIGREPKFEKNWFFLDKVVIYGKEK